MEMKVQYRYMIKEVLKATDNVKVPQSIYDELAYMRKESLTEKDLNGSFLIIVMKKNGVMTDDLEFTGKLAPIHLETAKVILNQAIEAVKGNGDDHGKIRVKYVLQV